MKDYRTQLLEAAASLEAEEVRQMTDDQLWAGLNASLGLPPGTRLTDEQLEMILKIEQPSPAPHHAPDGAAKG